jgi:class 3 adenylate cyclase
VGSLLLADISGYSRFLNNVQAAHREDAADGQMPAAYGMMASMLEGIAAKIDPPFSVLKFEGDAAFAVARTETTPSRSELIDRIVDCYSDFVARWAAADEVWTCTCDACSLNGPLDLKFIVHHGEFFVQAIGATTDVVGPEVNVAHRLLKNDAATVIRTRGYALFTEEAVEALGLPLEDAAGTTETIDDGRVVKTRVIGLASSI